MSKTNTHFCIPKRAFAHPPEPRDRTSGRRNLMGKR